MVLWWRWYALIAAVADAAPDVCIRFAPKPEKTSRYLREGLVDLEIGVQSNMPEIRLQRLFEDRFVGVVRKGHPLAKQAEIGVKDYVAWPCGCVTRGRVAWIR